MFAEFALHRDPESAWATKLCYQYEPRPNRDGPVIKLLLELAWQRPEQGFGKLFKRLRRLGHGGYGKRRVAKNSQLQFGRPRI
jgi:hypothetical protein